MVLDCFCLILNDVIIDFMKFFCVFKLFLVIWVDEFMMKRILDLNVGGIIDWKIE